MDVAKAYPIAERFHSIQGEGEHAGRAMHFVRLAGCNVGKAPVGVSHDPLRLFPNHTICTNVFGESFLCDTDYSKAESITVADIIADTHEKHICVTGGEPLLYDLLPITYAADAAGILVHIETSGTKRIPAEWLDRGNVWITCSPKEGFLVENLQEGLVDELKFTVSAQAEPAAVVQQIERILSDGASADYPAPMVWLQPINGVHELYRDSAMRAMEVLRIRPEWRLCVQVHKAIGVR